MAGKMANSADQTDSWFLLNLPSRRSKGKVKPMASKYRNRKTEYMGIGFDSQKEMKRYQELLLLERAGVIQDVELQPRYDLIVNGHKLGFYRADFRYKEVATGTVVVEDVKGVKTAVYSLKKKLVRALYDIEIIEV